MSILTKLKGPWRITFDTNPDLCNIRCIMCEGFSKYRKENVYQNRLMDFNLIEKVIKDTINFGLREIIPSTMGEPLLYPDFKKLLDLVKKYGLKLNLTTNGTFPIHGVEEWAQQLLPVLSDIKISINGVSKATSKKIMDGINPQKQLENIKTFIKIRDQLNTDFEHLPTITFQVTFMESNLRELPELLKLAIDLNIDRLKGHHLWITHPELQEENLRRDENSIQRWNDTVVKLNDISNNYRIQDRKRIMLENIYVLSNLEENSIVPKDLFCPFLGKEAWIAWDGTFNVCCALDELRRSFGTFGNVKEANLINLWNSPAYNNLVKNWGNNTICKMCNMRKVLKDIRG